MKKTICEYWLGTFKNFSFKGRASRKEYWLWTLLQIIILYVFGTFSVYSELKYPNEGILLIYLISISILFFATLWQSIAVCVRRLHDLGHSGWWYLLILIPYVGIVVILIFMLFKGQPESNKYGDPEI